MKKRLVSTFTALLMMCSIVVYLPGVNIFANAKSITVFAQTDSRWANHQYGYSNTAGTTPATISSGGCGILSYVNAVYYLNGNFIEPTYLADWSVNHGYRVNGVGTSLSLYQAFADSCGSSYGFTYNGSSSSYATLREHLQAGEVAVGSAPGHLMAVVDYDSSSGKFLILDSYRSSNRLTYPDWYTWQTESVCRNTSKLQFSSFYFFKSTDPIPPVGCSCSESYAGTYEVTTSQYPLTIRNGHGTGYSKIGEMPKGAHCTVTKADGSWAHVEYNGISGYASMEYLTRVNVNHDPIGVVDRIEGGAGKVNVYGWAFDPDNSSKSLEIHVYIGGPAGSANTISAHGGIIANAESSDVNNAYGISGAHRFNAWIETTARGNQPIYVYAINSEGGNNPCIGSGTVNISEADTTKPVISNVKITDVSEYAYTVTCTVTDNVGIDRVQFPTWTLENGQDDIQPSWETNPSARGTINGNTVTYWVGLQDHNNKFGIYRTHIYAYDTSGNWTCVPCDDVRLGWGEVLKEGAGQTIPDGDYIIVSELGRRVYLDIPGVEFPASEGIDVAICNNVLPRKSEIYDTWTVKYLGDGFYKIVQNEQCGKDRCLTISNESLAAGTELITYRWYDGDPQKWSIAATDHGYTIQSKSSSWYIDVRDGLVDTGTKVQTCWSNGSKAQSWCFIPVESDNRPIEDGEYYIKSSCGEVWLDADGDWDYKNGSNIQIWGSKTDSYNIAYYGNGYYTIREKTSGLAVEVEDEDKAAFMNRKNIRLADYTGERRQLWKIVDEGNGIYRFVSKLNGYTLDLSNRQTEDGSNVKQHPYVVNPGGLAQKWTIEKVHKHSYTSKITKSSTCTEYGVKTYTCECGDTYTEKIPAIGHKWNAVIYTWSADNKTCTATRICANDSSHKETETVNTTSSVTKQPTCINKGIDTNTATFKNTAFAKQTKNVEKPTIDHHRTTTTVAPTETTAGYDKHTCDVCGDFYIDNIVPPIPVTDIPTVSYVPGDSAVKLTWTTAPGAENYAVYGYISNKWRRIAEVNDTSYTLKDLKAGKEYKVAVIAMKNGNWNHDYSNAIVVSPKAEEISRYPKVTDIEYSEQYHQFRLTWNAVNGATEYGIAVKLGGKWKIQAYTNKTNFTSPKLREGSTVEMVICAKVNGEWDISSINNRAFKVTVK